MNWQDHARCRDLDPSLFYLEPGTDTSHAIAICNSCPVRAQCLQHALDNDEAGIWGGATERQRERIKGKRGAPHQRGPARLTPDVVRWQHGTPYGYKQHHRYGVPPCPACLEARNRYQQTLRPSRARYTETPQAKPQGMTLTPHRHDQAPLDHPPQLRSA